MDEKKAKGIWREAYLISLQYQHLVEPKDYAQRAVLFFIQNPERRCTTGQLIIDFLRQDFGRLNKKTQRTPLKKHHPSRKVRKDVENLLEHSQKNELYNPGQKTLLVAQCLEHIEDTDDRVMFQLHYVWGLRINEIGNLYGLSESRISQKIHAIEDYLIQKLNPKRKRKSNGTCEKR